MADAIKIGKVTLKPVGPDIAQKIKIAANILVSVPTLALGPEAAIPVKPGKERWPVKTVTDPDNDQLNRNIINDEELGHGYVKTTVEELINIPRPSDMVPVSQDFAAYQEHRSEPVETTIWQLTAEIIALKMEADGDYHLVLQGVSGDTMIGEVPNPDPKFVNPKKCPAEFVAGIKEARKMIDTGLRPGLSTVPFVGPVGKNLIPAEALTPAMTAALPAMATAPAATGLPPDAPFKAKVNKKARITGIGFFDRVHGQTGVSQTNGIELHPIINIEWLK